MPLYSGLIIDWLINLTFTISKGCMTHTCTQPQTQPQIKSFTKSTYDMFYNYTNFNIIYRLSNFKYNIIKITKNTGETIVCFGFGRLAKNLAQRSSSLYFLSYFYFILSYKSNRLCLILSVLPYSFGNIFTLIPLLLFVL